MLWDLLPDGLKEFFDIESYEKTDIIFRLVLIEKNILPSLPEEYRGKKVINTVTKSSTVDYFPIKGRKCELILKRRFWKFDNVEKMLSRSVDICAEGTKIEKKFADFLKENGFNNVAEFDRYCYSESSESQNI